MNRRWLALTGVLVVGALFLGMIVAPGHGLALASYADENLSALVPNGWHDEQLVAPYGTAVLAWVDSGNPHASEEVQATASSHLTPEARARALALSLRHTAGYVQSYLGPVEFFGGRPAWELEYYIGHYPHATFEFDACSPAIAMTVTVSASGLIALNKEQLTLAQDAEPKCDGPAFTSPDRADLAIPLRLPT
jgi:hypothetical protein